MKRLNKNIMSALIISSCITTSIYASTDMKPLSKLKTHNHNELLFFQRAHSGSIAPTKDGCNQLILTNLKPDVLYFADSPSRVSGHLTLAQFAETLAHSEDIDKINPNAIVHFKDMSSGQPRNLVGSLTQASYDNKKFTYTLCSFQNIQVKQGEIRGVNLFVDPIHRWPP